jgi:putative ABC transport system ATP-binding protein
MQLDHVDSVPVLSVTALVKRFGALVVLDGVDLTVTRGEAVAVVGPAGSGKSTLLHCLAGMVQPDGGHIRLLGWPIDALDEAGRSELRRTRFGFVFQVPQLLPELPAVENVALPLMLGGMSRGRAVVEAWRWFAPLGLTDVAHRRPSQLSVGQRQRVEMARALVAKPSVVFADEPTAELDSGDARTTIELLVSATREQNTSLIMATRDAGIAGCLDRVVTLSGGRLDAPAPLPAGPVPLALAPSSAAEPPPAEEPLTAGQVSSR